MLKEYRCIFSKKEEIKKITDWYNGIVQKYNIPKKALIIFNELLFNAYEHGNLQIKNKDILIAKDLYKKALEKKEKECNKKIEIFIYKKGDCFITKIKDDGVGFNFKDLENRKYSGRGIKISKKLADKIEYNEKGNEVSFYINLNS